MKVDSLTRGELAAAAPGGRLPSVAGWAPFTSTTGGFVVWTPSFALPAPQTLVPTERQKEAEAQIPESVRDQLPKDVHVVLFGGFFDGPTALYLAGSASLPESTKQQIALMGEDATFELIRDGLAQSDRIKLLGYRAITQGTMRGREIALEPTVPENDPFAGVAGGLGASPSVTITLRVFLAGEKIFAVGAITSPAASPTEPGPVATDVARFLDSFGLLP
jgi:hypothetical protein